MAITFDAAVDDGVLVITASGCDENAQQVIEYGESVIELVVKAGVKLVLCDERKLEYALNTLDTYEAAKTIAAHAPKVGRVAIVCNPKFLEDAKFWETVAVNRALQVRVVTDIARARYWLMTGRNWTETLEGRDKD